MSSGEKVLHALGVVHFLGQKYMSVYISRFSNLPECSCAKIRSLSSGSKWVFPLLSCAPHCCSLIHVSGLGSHGINVHSFPLPQQPPSPGEYEESASLGQGRWRTSANSKVLSDCLLPMGPCACSPQNTLGACCLSRALTASLPDQVRLIAASRRCPRASSSSKIFGRRYRGWALKI